jgi:hypothetical protein
MQLLPDAIQAIAIKMLAQLMGVHLQIAIQIPVQPSRVQ